MRPWRICSLKCMLESWLMVSEQLGNFINDLSLTSVCNCCEGVPGLCTEPRVCEDPHGKNRSLMAGPEPTQFKSPADWNGPYPFPRTSVGGLKNPAKDCLLYLKFSQTASFHCLPRVWSLILPFPGSLAPFHWASQQNVSKSLTSFFSKCSPHLAAVTLHLLL